jgi:hypothetical protein
MAKLEMARLHELADELGFWPGTETAGQLVKAQVERRFDSRQLPKNVLFRALD